MLNSTLGVYLQKGFGKGKLNFSVIIFFVCLLFTFLVWDHYFDSPDKIDRTLVSNIVLIMGSLFSVSAGLLVWSLESRKEFLEAEVKRRTEKLIEKEREAAAAEARRDEAEHQHRQVKEAYKKLKEAQQELIQSEKLASIGRVAASIVHDLNAPLVTMKGYSRMLIKGVVKEEGISSAELIYKQAERCHKIVNNLLSFSRYDQPKLKLMNLAQVIDETLRNLPLEFRSDHISIKKNYVDTGLSVQADADQLQRVFSNILINAWQAMLEDAKPLKEIKISILKLESSVKVVFMDRGPGMTEVQKGRIFEPFFTTKPAGKGTGLGLSHSFAIVQMHGGNITVKSREGRGAAFIIDLPRVTAIQKISKSVNGLELTPTHKAA